jgi:hypothetical protein
MPATSAMPASGQTSSSAAREGADIGADNMAVVRDPNVRTEVRDADIQQPGDGAMSAQCPHPEAPIPAGRAEGADNADEVSIGSPVSSERDPATPGGAPRRVDPGSMWARNGAPQLAPDPDRFTRHHDTTPSDDPGRRQGR